MTFSVQMGSFWAVLRGIHGLLACRLHRLFMASDVAATHEATAHRDGGWHEHLKPGTQVCCWALTQLFPVAPVIREERNGRRLHSPEFVESAHCCFIQLQGLRLRFPAIYE